jgi:hypothetical protein
MKSKYVAALFFFLCALAIFFLFADPNGAHRVGALVFCALCLAMLTKDAQ